MLDPEVLGIQLELSHHDLSLENRRATQNRVVFEASQAMRETGYGLKAATITPEGQGDVGSPNAILRAEVGGTVILRTGRRIPGVIPIAGVSPHQRGPDGGRRRLRGKGVARGGGRR